MKIQLCTTFVTEVTSVTEVFCSFGIFVISFQAVDRFNLVRKSILSDRIYQMSIVNQERISPVQFQ